MKGTKNKILKTLRLGYYVPTKMMQWLKLH